MYNIIVVDDEKIIRNGIKNYINGNSNDFCVIHDFADGTDAEEYLSENLKTRDETVHVVITDIKMVEMSGLQLAEWIHKNMPKIKTVLLSGYKEFEYARQAISFNVKQYLLKPTAPSDLMKLLSELKTALDSEAGAEKMSLSNIKHLYSLIAESKAQEAELYFGSILNELKFEPLDMVKESITELFSVIVNKLSIYFGIQITAEELQINSILTLGDISEIKHYGDRMLTLFISKMSAPSADSEEHILNEAKKFIEENYSRDISLQDVSDRVFFSPAYFSRFFKKITGEKFSDYLLRIRMTKAVELLKSGKKVEDAARLCGYNSAAYFSHIFKEYYAYTPKDYIRRF